MDYMPLKDMYDAIIEEINEYCKKKGNEKLIEIQKEKKLFKNKHCYF